jgi:hypothetical protein
MNVPRVAAIGSVTVFVAAVVAGLTMSGSPAEQRRLRLDQQRVSELMGLARAAERRWGDEQRLADTAEDLVDGRALTRLPTDPATGAPYEYRVTAPRQFEVCATFERPSRPEDAGDFWYHEAGRRCFAFDVTEDRN